MADDNNQNNNQNKDKNKGGGGGGGASGITFGGKLDPSQMNSGTQLKKLVSDQLITAATAVVATGAMFVIAQLVRNAFGVADKPSFQPAVQQGQPQQQGEQKQNNQPPSPGSAVWALKELKKRDPNAFNELVNSPKNSEVFGAKEQPVIDVTAEPPAE